MIKTNSKKIHSQVWQLAPATSSVARPKIWWGQIQPMSLRGRLQLYLLATSHYGFTTLREMKCTSQHFCDKTMDDKMALYCKCCFRNCTQSWQIGYFVGLLRAIASIAPPGFAPGHPWFWRTTSSKLFAWVQCKSTPI